MNLLLLVGLHRVGLSQYPAADIDILISRNSHTSLIFFLSVHPELVEGFMKN